jgi:hypothetical protein
MNTKDKENYKMLNTNWAVSAMILAATFAGQASAQQSEHYRGSFTLTFEARVGNVLLQPGSYSVKTLEGAKGIRITGDNGTASILSAGYDLKPAATNAKLVFVDANGTYALQSFESGALGRSLSFYVPKVRHGGVESASVKPTVEVGMQ